MVAQWYDSRLETRETRVQLEVRTLPGRPALGMQWSPGPDYQAHARNAYALRY